MTVAEENKQNIDIVSSNYFEVFFRHSFRFMFINIAGQFSRYLFSLEFLQDVLKVLSPFIFICIFPVVLVISPFIIKRESLKSLKGNKYFKNVREFLDEFESDNNNAQGGGNEMD